MIGFAEFSRSLALAFAPRSLTAMLVLLVVAGICALIVIVPLLVFQRGRMRTGHIPLLVVVLALLGAVSGYAGGLSRVGVVGDIIPAMLGLAGGVSAYLFGVNTRRGIPVAVGMASFALALLWSYSFGSEERATSESSLLLRDACIHLFWDPATFANADVYQRAVGPNGQRFKDCQVLIAGKSP